MERSVSLHRGFPRNRHGSGMVEEGPESTQGSLVADAVSLPLPEVIVVHLAIRLIVVRVEPLLEQVI